MGWYWGGIGGVISTLTASSSVYGDSIGDIFPARAGPNGRSAEKQALYQFFGVLITFGISILGGIITGFFVKMLEESESKEFDDSQYWHVPDEEIPYYHSNNKNPMNDSIDRTL